MALPGSGSAALPVVLALLALGGAYARVYQIPVKMDDRRLIPLTDGFRFSDGGECKTSAASFGVRSC